jgi:two-component system, NarL family, response regulator NreC
LARQQQPQQQQPAIASSGDRPERQGPGDARLALRVLLADDHQLVCESLKALLEREGFQVVGTAQNGREAVELARELHPEVAILDLAMPVLNGIDAARAILQDSPSTNTVVLTMHSQSQYILEALRVGVRGYVLKSQAAADLAQAIREVSRGMTYVSPAISRAVVEAYVAKSDTPPDPLTPRERQVLQLIAEGKRTKTIASLLGVSVKTAESHRARIMEKLEIHDTAGLVRYAIRRGLVQA